ncbi:MAG: IS110 family transposase [Chloroflexales bacterium]|nr:IS110 family transposase [Chloroflexales bacterium]
MGVDITATSFAAAWTRDVPTREPARTFAQTPDGFVACQAWLTSTGAAPAATLLVLEATGGYWVTLAVPMQQAGYAVSVVNLAQAHAFARSLLRRATTDALDAQVLAQLAADQSVSWRRCAQVIRDRSTHPRHHTPSAQRLARHMVVRC